MNFASYDFWRLLVLCFIGSRLVMALARAAAPASELWIGKLCLAATALTLLGSESPLTLACFLWVVLLGWACVVLRDASLPRGPRLALFGLLLVAQLAPLFYYKYWNFLIHETLGLDARIPSVLIPMGLSFYTFQTLGFWIDHAKTRQAAPTFLDYLNFSSFFPQIVAGPIEKSDVLLPQIRDFVFKIRTANLAPALRWIILGLGYKLVVADNIGTLSSTLRIDPANAWQTWFECFAFSLRIYFDFAGYSFIAVGLGLLFGVSLTLNFRCPYWSADLREFWRNWHVTLGAWLRDYIYLPLGGRRSSRWMLNILIVFLISGIWHGAGWGFLIWGLLHGIGVAFCGLGKPWTRLGPLRVLATFAYTTFAWLFFFETDPAALRAKAFGLLDPAGYGLSALKALPSVFTGPTHVLTTGLIVLVALGFLALEAAGLKRRLEPYHLSRHPALCCLLVFLIVLLAPMEESSFIYFNF